VLVLAAEAAAATALASAPLPLFAPLALLLLPSLPELPLLPLSVSSPLFDGEVEEDEAALGRRSEGDRSKGDSGEERIRTSTDEVDDDDDDERRRRWAWLLLAGVRSDSAMVVARVERRSRVRPP